MDHPLTTTGSLYRGQASASLFQQWLQEYFESQSAVFYTQHPFKQKDGIYIGDKLPGSFSVYEWEQGRIINNEFELRWHAYDDIVMLLLCTESAGLATQFASLCEWEKLDSDYEVQLTQHLLVGTLYRRGTQEFFAQAGIPRLFVYPVDTTGYRSKDAHVLLYGKHYCQSGRTVLTRFTHFEIREERRA